jgi:hypothetical protein
MSIFSKVVYFGVFTPPWGKYCKVWANAWVGFKWGGAGIAVTLLCVSNVHDTVDVE